MKGYSVGALENTKQKVSLPFFQASYLGLCKAVQLTHFRSRTRLITLCLVLYVPSLFFIFIYHLLSFILLSRFRFGTRPITWCLQPRTGLSLSPPTSSSPPIRPGALVLRFANMQNMQKKCKICNICKICKIFKICKISKICKICLSSQLCHHHHLSWGFFQIVMTFDQGGLLFPEWISL